MPSSFIRSRCGVTLLNVSLILVLIGGLVIAGYAMMGPIIKRGKITDTKTTINSNVDAIMSWAVTNCRIPEDTEFKNVVQNPYDAWGNPLVYIYDEALSKSKCDQICGLTSTKLKYNNGTTTTDNIAFIILSSQYSPEFHHFIGATGNVRVENSLFLDGTLRLDAAADPPDIVRIVTLEELKIRIECYGGLSGPGGSGSSNVNLRILNPLLPNACSGEAYSATLFASGGVTPYSWSTTTPNWTIDATGKLTRTTPPTINESITATLTDSKGITVSRTYNLNVVTCSVSPPGTPGNPITFNPPGTTVEDNWNGGDISDEGTNSTDDPSGKFNMTVVDGGISTISIQNGTTSSCIWYQRPLSLTGKKLRAYFNYTFTEGAGFSFAMVPATPGQTTISSCDETSDLGLGSKILTTAPLKNTTLDTLLGAEFKVNNINTGVGLASNCVAIILPKSETCTFTTGNGTNSWQTGSTVYHVRVELDATIAPYTYKVWLTSNTANLAALQNIDAAYSAAAPTPVTRTLTADQIGDLSSFFLGFTAGQHSNARVNMTLNGLKFALY